jgi:hypothetical protein
MSVVPGGGTAVLGLHEAHPTRVRQRAVTYSEAEAISCKKGATAL